MRTVHILGTAPNLGAAPRPLAGDEVWCSNNPRAYKAKAAWTLAAWTGWFNLHSYAHMRYRYPQAVLWYQEQDGTRPIYTRDPMPLIAGNRVFPGPMLQRHFAIDGVENRYFTFTGAWQIAYALYRGTDRIVLSGFEMQRDRQYDFERPCVFYWIDQARRAGVEVILPPDLAISAPGDPRTYTGPLYGYESLQAIGRDHSVPGGRP